MHAATVLGNMERRGGAEGVAAWTTQKRFAKKEGHLKRSDGPLLSLTGSSSPHWQPGNLNDAMRVLQLKLPLAFKYSVVYQKVQSSTGSTVIAL
jgi:hypothetical protein